MQNIIVGLRGAQVVLAIIILGLTGWAVNRANSLSSLYGFDGNSDETNFLLFNSIWTFLIAVPYLVLSPLYLQKFAHKYALIAVEAVTLLFWFAGFIAVAAVLPPASLCKLSSVCKGMQAATVFGAFEWLLFVATTVLGVVLPILRGGEDSTPKPEAAVDMQAHPGV
ncbi:hypothetical protein EMPG_10273 [Blastomyces silverae]|uniref:MARVEL domain-containing protein n=1 Tax=Blastomyces silverae TaxID=2060906 RepID=A0A0H1B4G6_9EURO|nr:hypothetical protein EMPG_10273 [Blastomyces silverae]